MLMTRPLPIEARLKPEGAGVGVGGQVAPLATEFRDSLLRRLLGTPTPNLIGETNTQKCKIIKNKKVFSKATKTTKSVEKACSSS